MRARDRRLQQPRCGSDPRGSARRRPRVAELCLVALAAMALQGLAPALAAQPETWTQTDSASNPGAREGSAMVYDAASGQLLLFGGNHDAANVNDTWSYDGRRWHQLSPATSPPARIWPAAAYDAANGTVVMFGGGIDGFGTVLGDTWVWDGTNWTEKAPSTAPSPRADAQMAYDPVSRKLVLFGGAAETATESDETWTWDGSSWTQLLPLTSPPPRMGAGFADGFGSSPPVLFGGETLEPFQVELGDTWTWDGAAGDWTAQPVSTSPSARSHTAMAVDAAHGDVVLFGGRNHVSGPLGDTWLWNGQGWSQASPPASPLRRSDEMVAYDPHDQRVDLFGGQDADALGWLADTWGWDGSTWNQEDLTAPSDRQWAAAAPQGAGVVLFGGQDIYGSALGDTWVWNGRWQLLPTAAAAPAARYGSAVAYDAPRNQVVLFGGISPTLGYLHDTWTWSGGGSGSGWQQAHPSASLPGDFFAAMAYDALHQQTVLFGGCCAGHGQTWQFTDTWDGSNWTQQSPAVQPPSRDGAAMVWDAAHQQIVLFGGRNELFDGTNTNATMLNDTWTWDGTTWTEQSPATSPPAREFASMIYDSNSGSVVLFGGCSKPDLTYDCQTPQLGDTWTWDGSNWTQQQPAASPPPRAGAATAVDGSGQPLIVGGQSGPEFNSVYGTNFVRDTWTWGSPAPVAAVPETPGLWLLAAIGMAEVAVVARRRRRSRRRGMEEARGE